MRNLWSSLRRLQIALFFFFFFRIASKCGFKLDYIIRSPISDILFCYQEVGFQSRISYFATMIAKESLLKQNKTSIETMEGSLDAIDVFTTQGIDA